MPKSICDGCKHSTEPAPTCRACSLAHAAAVKRLARRVAKLEGLMERAAHLSDRGQFHPDAAVMAEYNRILARRARADGGKS